MAAPDSFSLFDLAFLHKNWFLTTCVHLKLGLNLQNIDIRKNIFTVEKCIAHSIMFFKPTYNLPLRERERDRERERERERERI